LDASDSKGLPDCIPLRGSARPSITVEEVVELLSEWGVAIIIVFSVFGEELVDFVFFSNVRTLLGSKCDILVSGRFKVLLKSVLVDKKASTGTTVIAIGRALGLRWWS